MLPQFLTVISFILALFASWVVLEPMFGGPRAETDLAKELLREVQYRKEEIFLALEELEQDFRAGKISAADYQSSKSELLADAALQLAEIERLA